MSDMVASPCARGTEQAPGPPGLVAKPLKALPPANVGASPRPWRVHRQPTFDGSAVYFLRILDAKGNRVADFYPHESVGGRGLEQATADAGLIVALANGPAADAVEREASDRHAAPVEIPEAERLPTGAMERLL